MGDRLWQGDIEGIKHLIDNNLKTRQKSKALKKWQNYFDKNRTRMQYQDFKKSKLPCGSGCVEDDISSMDPRFDMGGWLTLDDNYWPSS